MVTQGRRGDNSQWIRRTGQWTNWETCLKRKFLLGKGCNVGEGTDGQACAPHSCFC